DTNRDALKKIITLGGHSSLPRLPYLAKKFHICSIPPSLLLFYSTLEAPKLLKKIHAELFPDCSGNIKLCCQFGEIHEDSTVTWIKDSKLLAQVNRSAGDDSPVSLAIVQTSIKDQGLYYCCLKNVYGKVTAEFNLTSEVLKHLSSYQDIE
ncbi:unnamed protein product, partial [Caretta caretta]